MAIRAALLCLASFVLSACGGGGGSSSDGGGATNPPPPAPFALTEANAVEAVSYVLGPLEQAFINSSGVAVATLQLRQAGRTQLTATCVGPPAVPVDLSYTDRDSSGTVTVGDVVKVESALCAGLRRKNTLTVTRLTPLFDQIEGRVELDVSVDPPGIQVTGSFDVALTISQTPAQTEWRVTNAILAVTKANTTQTVRITNAQFTQTATSYTYSLTGGNVDSGYLAGTYTFATVTPFTGLARRLPNAGELMLTSPSGARVKVTPPATPGGAEDTVDYAVAASSSGAFASAQQTIWTAFLRGWLFSWRPNERPVITNLTIEPSNPSPGAQLYASYSASDPNGDPLTTTYQWKRNGTVVGNSQFLSIATARNDQIGVTVTVSDNTLTATATASITIGNPAPQLTLTLTPPNPDTTVDLVAVPTVYEPDNDPVTLTYQWSRNGTVIAGRTTATLPASETSRGQTFSVRVTASDGASTVQATASATIVDAPARVTVLSPPTTVAYGAPVTFTATVSDADGDSVGPAGFELAYGPAGMTIDPTTGEVSWTANGAMFDRTMRVGWGITVDAATTQPATGTFEITDSSRNYPLVRFGAKIPSWPSGLLIDDFDDDNDVEMLVMSQRWLFELERDGAGGYRQSWAYPYSLDLDTQYSYNASRGSVASGDVDGDGRHEIFTAVGRTIMKLDGVERRPVASRQLSDQYAACADFIYGDLENDGAPELICLSTTDYYSGSRIIVLRASDLSVRDELPQANYGFSLALGNVDSDAAIELVTSGGYVFHGPTLVNQWLYGQGFGMDVDTGDLDGDGIEEIVAAADWMSIRGYSATLKSPIWEVQRGDLDSLLVADVAGDGRPEILVGDGQWGELTIYRYNTATNTADVVDSINSQDHGVTSIAVGNVDNDSGLEIVWGSGASSSGADKFVVAGFHPTLSVEWTNDFQLDGPFYGGMLAGSALMPRAPLFLSGSTNSGYSGSRLVRMTTGGAVQASSAIGTYYSINALDVVDYDNDITDEAFLGFSYPYYDGRFGVYDFFADRNDWASGGVSDGIAAADVTHADLTGDQRAELIGLSSTGVLYVHDVFNQVLVWQSTTLNEGRKVLVANIDGDAGGQLEIVAVTARNVYVYKRNATFGYVQSGSTYQTDRGIIDADVGDTDGDGDLEVVLLTGATYSWSGTEVVTLNASLQPQTIGTFALPWEAQTIRIEPSAEPRKNLIVSRVATQLYNTDGASLAIVGARTGGIIFESPALIGAVQRDSIHYVTLPGETRPRISIGTSAAMYLTQ
jgi:hypothetical protein